ncbi:hypothetical protein E1J23_15025 [Xanthomonas gardneri]|nr:hypothetical protein BJD10_07230 [Xanthomonas hortorum pv. gardneri]NMI48759.1 hypothetical protein [Xanthomonas hortorum pv. gardneri]PPU35890.1 hypothetical protein XcyCFBP4188_20935 [Xanthomonas hortorum pv. cynarae]
MTGASASAPCRWRLAAASSVAAVISLIVWVAKRASRKSPIATTGSAVPKTAQSRLLELDTLRSQQLITDAEYHQRRTHILSEI